MIKFLFVSYLLTTLIKQVIIFVEWWETYYWFLVHITSNCKEGKDEVALKATLPAMIIEVIMILEFITKIIYFFAVLLFLNLLIWKRKKRCHLFDCSKKYQILKKTLQQGLEIFNWVKKENMCWLCFTSNLSQYFLGFFEKFLTNHQGACSKAAA